MLVAFDVRYTCTVAELFSLWSSDATGKFPEYPGDDEGGSAAIFKEKDPAEVEAELKAKVSFATLIY